MNAPILLHPISAPRAVPDHIVRPAYVLSGQVAPRPLQAKVHGAASIARIRRAGAAARRVLDAVLAAVRPGISTDALDAVAHAATIAEGAYPSPLYYHGFPKSICTSVNEVVCHGIPDARLLKDGDIINCDITVYLDGVHGDCSETVPVGTVDAAGLRLIAQAYAALEAAMEQVRPGRRINTIGRAIQTVAKKDGFGVVRQFAGHGIGDRFHMPPQILHYYDRRTPGHFHAGMIFTIEPMLNEGDWRCKVLEDGWTAVSLDGGRSAQFEHTLLVTPTGCESLTHGKPWFQRGRP